MFLKLINQNEQDYHFAVKPISSSVYIIDISEATSSCSAAKYDEEHDIAFIPKEDGKESQYITLYLKIEKSNISLNLGTYQLCSHEGELLRYERIPVLK